MSRRESAASIPLAAMSKHRPSPAEGEPLSRHQVAAEISDVIVALRHRAQEHELKFLTYLLEMAFIEAFEQGQKGDRAK